MFPYNSSSHEISTETNAFVQNSMEDVVVLGKTSPVGIREGRGSEHARYCDIEFVNSSTMVISVCHSEDAAASDFSTVLPSQSGELSLTSVSEACQSVASSPTKHPTSNHLIYRNNNTKVYRSKKEHNHHNNRPETIAVNRETAIATTTGRAGIVRVADAKITRPDVSACPDSSANNSKSMSKPLSDNKTSFSLLNSRVLSLSVNLRLLGGRERYVKGVPSLVRILKSDRPTRAALRPDSLDNYSLLGSCLHSGDNNNVKSNFSLLSNNNDNYKSVILLSSTSNHYFLCVEKDGGLIAIRLNCSHDYGRNHGLVFGSGSLLDNATRVFSTLGSGYRLSINSGTRKDVVSKNDTSERMMMMMMTTTMMIEEGRRKCRSRSRSTKLKGRRRCCVVCVVVSAGKRRRIQRWPWFRWPRWSGRFYAAGYNTIGYATSSSITLIVPRNEVIDQPPRSFPARIAPSKRAQSSPSRLHLVASELTQRACVPLSLASKQSKDSPSFKRCDDLSIIEVIIAEIVGGTCYKTSCTMISSNQDIEMSLYYCNNGISCTVATITVGALLFQDNCKSKALQGVHSSSRNPSKVDFKSVTSQSKSTISDMMMMYSFKEENGDRPGVMIAPGLAVYIPNMTTCKPTMTLTCQSASRTIGVPGSRADLLRPNYFEILRCDQIRTRRDILQGEDSLSGSLNVDPDHPDRRTTSTFINTRTRTEGCDRTVPIIELPQQVQFQSNHNLYLDHQSPFGLDYAYTCYYYHHLTTHQCDPRAAYPMLQPNPASYITRARDTLFQCARRLISIVCAQSKLADDHATTKLERTYFNSIQSLKRILAAVLYSRAADTTPRTKTPLQHHEDDYNKPIMDYKSRWGIATILRLAGGGESSLNSAGAGNWGSTQATAPNNNNINQSGWVANAGNPTGNSPASSNWSGNAVNRSVPGNTSQNQGQVPPGNQNIPGNASKSNNPNQPPNQQSGPPTSQSNNAAQGTQNNNQWAQANKSNGQTSQNPSVQNNNSGGVPQQQQQQQQQQQPPTASGNNNNQSNNSGQGSAISATTAAANPSTKQQLEQLNTMREALFSQDGWGCQHVNQDTNWDVPTSPEPSVTKDGAPMWNATVNNGTDLWEANLRNGGQPPPQQQQKTPWGHTPATNIGGTWGEDDDTADTSMWTGTPAPAQTNVGQWTGATGNQTGMWGGSNWADPRIDHRDPRELRSVDPREMRDPRDHRMSLDPREHIRVIDPMVRDPRMADMRGDPRGISGRLNGGNTDAMWGQPPGPPHHQMSHQHPSGPPTKMLNPSNINQWAAPPPKDIIPGKPSGWEEPSPPTQRRNVPNYDDGTSLWGNPAANQRTMPGSKVTHWKDPTPNLARAGMQCPPGMPQSRMPGQPGMKPDISGPMWGHPGGPGVAAATASGPGAGSGSTGRNGTWTEPPHEGSSWDEPKTATSWNDAQLNPATWSGPTGHKPKQMGPATNWADSDIDPTPTWGHPAKPPLSKEVIWNSREFRYLCDLGFKKEDVELALRNRDMNREEALELLSQLRPLDQWRRHDTHSNYDPTNQTTSAPAYPRFNHVAQQMSFPPGVGVPSGSASGSVGGSVASASLLKLQQQQQQQAAVPLQQQQPNTNAPQPPFNQPSSRAQQNQPNTQQLRMLVQQIQLAVQEGYLNHQILNQALAPQTLLLLNQLLQQIKVLQQLHQQHSVQNAMKGNSQSVLQISVQITKTKQQIANLQNQIAVQQATYMKQQQQQHPAPPSQSSDYYKSSVHDPMSALQNSFTDLTMNKEPPVSQQQSRLTQWKLPSLDKDGELVTEFSRAPGTTSKPGAHAVSHAGYPQSHNSSNMSHLLGQGDGTWSSRLTESGWPDPTNTDSTDGKDWQPAGAAAAFTDLVPEFEPGKPWKGTQMKSIEDDPSITPGSVVRSPLSLAAIKDPDAIFSSSSKTSPPAQQTNSDTSIPSLSNSTWTFNPPATTPSAFASSKNTWGESAPPPTAVTSELWGAPMSKVRGPPPGLGSKGASNASNGWAGLGTVGRSSSSWALQSGSNAGWVSTWLLLKNLTPQIDGSTLKTLCMQHGPVQDFRLYLNHGIALTKYSSRDEAIKAQGALNNCVLGNTTIFAESPADSEVHTLLQQLSHGGQQQGGGSSGGGWGLRPSTKNGPPPDTWGGSSSQLWGAPPSSNSLWSSAGIDSSEQQRATPSSLNSYLPGDLLGEDSSEYQT